MKEIKNNLEYQELLKGGKPVLLDFYADWCGPCRVLLPVVDKLSKKYENDFEIVKINVDANKEMAKDFNIRSIPTLFFVKDGSVVEKLNGLQSESSLENKINGYLNKVAQL